MIRASVVRRLHRRRARDVRPDHDSPLAENRRRAGRVHAEVLAVLLAVEPRCLRRKIPAGLRVHDMDEANHRRGDTTVAAEVVGGQPRGEEVWGRRTRRSGCSVWRYDRG